MEKFYQLVGLLAVMGMHFVRISNNEIAIPLPMYEFSPDDNCTMSSIDDIVKSPGTEVVDDEGYLHIQYDEKWGFGFVAVTGETEVDEN